MKKRINILVVDDDEAFRITMTGVLEREGYHVFAAANGYEAITLAKENSFDIVFMDIKMPGINGVDAYLEIKKYNPRTTVVIMTGYSQEDLIEKAIENGAYAILHKPFDLEYIIGLIRIKIKPVILIVDQSLSDTKTLHQMLKNKNYTVESVNSDEEAVKMVKNSTIDIIILDVGIPILNGIRTFELIHEYNPRIPVIMLTQQSEEENLRQAIQRGAYTYIYKPIDIDTILKTIEKILVDEDD